MQAPVVRLKAKAMMSRDEVVQLVATTGTLPEILRAIGEINRLKVNHKISKVRWATSKASNNSSSNNNRVTFNLGTGIVAQLINPSTPWATSNMVDNPNLSNYLRDKWLSSSHNYTPDNN